MHIFSTIAGNLAHDQAAQVCVTMRVLFFRTGLGGEVSALSVTQTS